jgi:hypothetical protein
MTTEKTIFVRSKKSKSAEPCPRVTHEPWSGYTRHDAPREVALPLCPAPRCRRARQCAAAHDELYCQRTHFSKPEQVKWQRNHPLRRALDAVPEVIDPTDLTERMERVAELAGIKRGYAANMTKRWKAGEFDALYGKYTARGVIKTPPPKIYVDAALSSATHTRVRALG